MNRTAHFLLTRFNVPMVLDVAPKDQPGDRGISTEWLTHRFDLFEQFCLSSVSRQQDAEFRWLIYFDERTPEAFRERALAAARHFPALEPRFVRNFDLAAVAGELRERMPSGCNRLITTRLDNDDAIRGDFMASVQRAAQGETSAVINFPVGYSHHDGRLYLDRQRSNPFTSLVESPATARTIFAIDHRYLGEVAPVRQHHIGPAWMQVIHGRNLCNQARGIRVDGRGVAERFHLDPSLIRIDPRAAILAEKIGGLTRIAREKGFRWIAREAGRFLTRK